MSKKGEKIFFTVVGLFRFSTTDFIKEGMKVKLVKEPDNVHDSEAIMVKMEGLGQIGYVANSIQTVVGDEAYSAGRLYDKFDKEASGNVVYNMGDTLQCVMD